MKNNFKFSIPVAILITLATVIYQRGTGPTYPKKVNIENGEQKVRVKLLRSHGGKTNAPVEIPHLEEGMYGTIHYKRFPTNESWSKLSMTKEGNRLIGHLPHQPPAGKLAYYIETEVNGKKQFLGSKNRPIIIRFKGDVPNFVLAPHIIFMFLSMLLSVLAALEALKNTEVFYKVGLMATGSLIFGGLFLGPIVQKYAFGVYWAGFPFDWDLTDNKLLISVIFWVLAVALGRKKNARALVLTASIVLLLMYAIPHSTMGSQYNYEEGQLETRKSLKQY